ncbi:hypothetical protein [Ornithinimicrobium avium]|uniref:Uncharacterized protein n=1 Tax=Ornithinimicrobium avium TaxID=2283195 RepID=A0A345NIP8_9MICO|nr:hypothetical protein [Ornithinimicrobium avium]AXH94906.1 hypothetical protein DV701_00755 [Ornithinimicrobium avium]
MSSVLACDPEELEATARTLRQLAAELDTVAAEVASATVQDWSGLAAIEQGARRGEAGDLLRSFTPQVEDVAAAISRVAVAAREEGALVRHHARLGEDAALERARLLALGAPTDPVAAVRWEARLEELGSSQRWHESLVAQAQERFDQVQQAVAVVLDRIRAATPEHLRDLALLVATTDQAVNLAKDGRALTASATTGYRLRRVRGRSAERTLHQMQQRIERNVARLRLSPPGWVSKIPGVGTALGAVGKAVPVLVVLDAGKGVLDGGGYRGWRGGVTRVLAVGAVVGTGVAVLVAAPAAAAVGLGAAATYQAWTIGNAVYDNRREIGQALARTWRRGSRGVSQFRRRAADRLATLRGEDRSWAGGPRPQPAAPGRVPVGVSA